MSHAAPRGHGAHMSGHGRALRNSAWLTGVYFLIELTIGIYTGFVAVISDAFHTFSAVGGMVPAMPARIMRERRQIPLCISCSPVWLTFKVLAMAFGAMGPVDRPALRDDSFIIGLQYNQRFAAGKPKEYANKYCKSQGHNPP